MSRDKEWLGKRRGFQKKRWSEEFAPQLGIDMSRASAGDGSSVSSARYGYAKLDFNKSPTTTSPFISSIFIERRCFEMS